VKDKPLALDNSVDLLAKEGEYYARLYITPYQWEAREKETIKSQARHVRNRTRLG
jgi:hypothetical protein